MKNRIANLLSQMTLEEKSALCSGLNFWETTPISRLNVPSVFLADGPHGVRREMIQGKFGNIFQQSIPATCFPPAVTMGSTWDKGLVREVGNAIGEECMEQGVSTILGPGINIKRSPLCGRNFEYFSEDPYFSGVMAEEYINGVQKNGVGTSLKHFAVNNQEYRRLVNSSEVDERAFREIYLAGFERAVKKAKPYTVMCSYNPINGIHASDNKKLLWDILREEWGFDGIVVSDWGAVNDRIKGILAGMDLEMPSSNGIRDAEIVRAVREGRLAMTDLDKTVSRILEYVFKCAKVKLNVAGYISDYAKHHTLARKTASSGAVLLKNKDNILPLNSSANFSVVGQLAKKMRYQGSGSSRLNPKRLVSFCDHLDSTETKYIYSAGYSIKSEKRVEKHKENAVARSKDKDYVIIFAGLTDTYESESFDRTHLEMPEAHNQLIAAIAEVNPNVIVVLNGGSPVVMPWLDKVAAVLNIYLSGESGGSACYDLLFGTVAPSGKLAETYPNCLDDILSNKYYLMGPNGVEYRESIYVGYRYFDTAKKAVAFPFGFGLSYTTFEYSDLSLSSNDIFDDEKLVVSFNIKNTGDYDGAEVCQLYVHDKESTIFKAEKELKGFDKIFLQKGEIKRVEMELDRSSFAYYNVEVMDWSVESGEYEILIGASSRDIRLSSVVNVTAKRIDPVPNYREIAPVYYEIDKATEIPQEQFEALSGRKMPDNTPRKKGYIDFNSTVGDCGVSVFGKIFKKLFSYFSLKAIPKDSPSSEKKMVLKGALDMPVRNFFAMSMGVFPYDGCIGLMDAINGHFFRGIFKVIKSLLKKRIKKSSIYKK